MENSMKRPVSVWIAQILILISGLPFSFIALLSVLSDSIFLKQAGPTAFSLFAVVLFAILKLALVSVYIFAFWGLAKRKEYGRWLAIIWLVLIIGLSVVGQIFRTSGPMEYYKYENSAQLLGGFLASALIYGLLGLLLYKLAFCSNVKAFFQAERTTPSAEAAATPPS